MTQTATPTRTPQSGASTGRSATVATKGSSRRPVKLYSRRNRPEFSIAAPVLLRYLQAALLAVGVFIGCMAIPLMSVGQQFADQSQTEAQHASLSAIQTEVSKANELALTSMLTGKPDRNAFQQQMGTVAKVVVGSQGATIDTALLGDVNSALVHYTAYVNAALTAEQAELGSGKAEMVSAEQILDQRVLPGIEKLLADTATTTSPPVANFVLGWVALGVGGVVVISASVLLAQRTKRVLNLGIVGVLASLTVGSVMLAALSGFVGVPTDAALAHSLTAAEGTIAKMRAAELTYVLDPTNKAAASQVSRLLQDAKAQLARTNNVGELRTYESAWHDVVADISAGKTADAIKTATIRSGPALSKITADTNAQITSTRDSVMGTLRDGAPRFSWIGAGMIAVGVGVAVPGVFGVQMRKREYR